MPCLSPNQDSSLQDRCDLWQHTFHGIRLQSFHSTPSFYKNHFCLQVFSNSLNSSGAPPEAAKFLFRSGTMSAFQITRRVSPSPRASPNSACRPTLWPSSTRFIPLTLMELHKQHGTCNRNNPIIRLDFCWKQKPSGGGPGVLPPISNL